MKKLHVLALVAAALSCMIAGTFSQAAFAGPPGHRPGYGYHPGARPPMHRPAPPPPARHHHRPHHHHGWNSAWVWGPLAAGTAIWGISELVNQQNQVTALQAQANALAAAQQAKQASTIYWCEAEKGYYPQVRACPSGWTALPAVPVN